ncbi:GntR family transcriptional regulator [Catenulispora sp. GAS73]|uniref:GntR family transcriptional regulator n=1 Tax=Catenulispora sp. GAS73 TaxID=3156269 RepID=UPI003518392D
MIDFHIDRAGSVPAYAQLVQQVREALRLGVLHPGDKLPTVREVVTSCAVNAATVLKAYRELELSGLVEARQGAGTYVSGTLGGAADPAVMDALRGRLAGWVGDARTAGLEDDDLRALMTSVLAEPPGELTAEQRADAAARSAARSDGPSVPGPDAQSESGARP